MALTGPYSKDHGLNDEVEDVEALLSETGAHYVFGLSDGAKRRSGRLDR